MTHKRPLAVVVAAFFVFPKIIVQLKHKFYRFASDMSIETETQFNIGF